MSNGCLLLEVVWQSLKFFFMLLSLLLSPPWDHDKHPFFYLFLALHFLLLFFLGLLFLLSIPWFSFLLRPIVNTNKLENIKRSTLNKSCLCRGVRAEANLGFRYILYADDSVFCLYNDIYILMWTSYMACHLRIAIRGFHFFVLIIFFQGPWVSCNVVIILPTYRSFFPPLLVT